MSYYGKDLDRAQKLSTFSSSTRLGMPASSQSSSKTTNALSPLVVGRTGYSAITISHALPGGLAQPKLASQRCCCYRYAEHLRCITATSSASDASMFRRPPSTPPGTSAIQISASAAIPNGLRINGMERPTPASPPAILGFPSTQATQHRIFSILKDDPRSILQLYRQLIAQRRHYRSPGRQFSPD